ncbi:hypothetical protein Tco_0459091 [Tanacetum coccineum]
MDEDNLADEEEHKSPPPNIDKPESPHTQDNSESASDSSCPEIKKYDNILPLIERQLVKYLRKASRVVRVDSLVSYLVMASMVKTEENARFSLKLRKIIVDHLDQEKLKSKKVKLEALGYHVE